MSDADVLGYLQSKNLPLKSAGPTEVHTHCWFHGEDGHDRGRLYINIDPNADVPGCYFCHVCGEKGNLVTLKRHFGDETTTTEEESFVRYEIIQAAAAHYHQTLTDFEEVLAYLRGPDRGMTVDTIIDQQLGYAAEEAPLYPYLRDLGYAHADIVLTGLVTERESGRGVVESFRDMITIPYFVAGNVVTIRGRAWPYDKDSKRPKYKTLPGVNARLFNSDATWHQDEIVVTEGEFDCLILKQLGVPAVGVPGAQTWQDSWDGYVEDAKRIFVVFDGDKAGEAGYKKIREKFGSKVRQIKLAPTGKCDPTEWVVAKGHDANDFMALTLEANMSGGILVTVDDALEEFTGIQGLDGLKFDVQKLDSAIKPGLLAAQLMVVLAKTNTGKTIWLLNMLQRMAMGHPDKKFLFLSLEQTRGEWWDRARRIYRFFNLDDSDKDALDFWRERLLIADKNRITSAEVMQSIDDFDYRMGCVPDCIFLDYLGYWSRAFRGEDYARLSEAIMELKALGKDLRIPVVTPHQVNRMIKDGEMFGSDSARGSGVIEETADFVLGLYSADNALARDESEKSGIVSAIVQKSRHGGRGVKVDFQFAPLSLAMVPIGNKNGEGLVALAKDELQYAKARETWEQALYRHRTGFKGALQQGAMP